jgi:integrase
MSVRERTWWTAKQLKLPEAERGEKDRKAWVCDYFDQSGVRRLKTFSRQKDAKAWASQTAVDVGKGEHVAESATVTVKVAGEDWIKSCEAAELERATVDQYRQHLNLHIVPFLGRTKLSQLSVPAVRQFQDRLRSEDRSPAMVKRVTVSLGSILADAQERGLVARNVVREMARRRGKGANSRAERRQKARLQVGVEIPTTAEIGAIIGAASGRWHPLLITATFTGMRASELRGLRWSDVDLKQAIIHVRQRADRYSTIGMPKSDAGQRKIPVGPIVVNTLREWKLACPKGDLDLVFPTGAGNIEWHPNIINRGWKPAQVVAGVVNDAGEAKYPGLHALRHFYASWCINRVKDGGLELPGKLVQERLGHSSITMTMDVYGHLFPSTDDGGALAEAERRLLSPVHAT